MKICILTYPIHSNVGFVLQAWALQRIVLKLGHEVETIGFFVQASPKWRCIAAKIKRLLKFILSRGKNRAFFQYIPSQEEQKITDKNTYSFIDRNLLLTPAFYSYSNFKTLKLAQYDAFIVGSDQVWRRKYLPSIRTYFFDFVHSQEKKIRKISYAASFGVDYLEYSKKEIRDCAKLLQDFYAVSVREESGIDLCRKFFGTEAQLVLDPTLLLEKEDYLTLIRNQPKIHTGRYGVSYILDKTDRKMDFLRKVQVKMDIPFHEFLNTQKLEDIGPNCIKECIYPEIEDFLRLYRDADYIVTDSFHGMVFAIIFRKPFSVIVNPVRGAARFYSLLKQLGLENRMITELMPESEQMSSISAVLPIETMEKKLSARQQSSLRFLKDALL